MKVIVETNFVLELVFSRDKFVSCRELVAMAQRGDIEIFLPAYSFVEPNEAIIRRRKARVQAHDTLTRELREITRSTHFKAPASQLAELTGLLIEVGESEERELRDVIAQLLASVTVIELNNTVLQEALALQEQLSLSPQDSVVFASVLSVLRRGDGAACFITKNSKDFSLPGVAEMLLGHSCKLLFDFENGHNFILSSSGTQNRTNETSSKNGA